MKKILNISLLMLAALSTLTLTSCLHEMDEVFDDDAVIRMNNAMEDYENVLTSNGGKWQLEYYSNTTEPGYTYVLTFAKDGSVVMSGHNKWINYIKNNNLNTSAFGSMTSMWDVIGDNGLVLTFNSYNDFFHLFSSPDAVPTTGGTMTAGGGSTAGRGHEGDYEFNLMKFSGDTIYMTGKKYNYHMIMTRLPQDTNDSTYLTGVANLNKNMFTSKLPYVYIVLPNGNRWIVKSAASGYMKIYPEGQDEVTTSESHNFIITNDGMAFRDELVLEGYKIQRFKRQADGTALCVEDNQTLITADPLSVCLTNSVLNWKSNMKKEAAGGIYSEYATQISSETKNIAAATLKNATLKEIQINYIDSISAAVVTMNFSKSSKTYPARFQFTVASSTDNQISFTYKGMTDYGERFYAACPTIEKFIQAFAAAKFDLTSPSLLAPTTITMAENGNAGNFIVLTLQ